MFFHRSAAFLGKTLDIKHSFIPAMFLGTTDPYHFIPLLVTLIVSDSHLGW